MCHCSQFEVTGFRLFQRNNASIATNVAFDVLHSRSFPRRTSTQRRNRGLLHVNALALKVVVRKKKKLAFRNGCSLGVASFAVFSGFRGARKAEYNFAVLGSG